MLSSNVFLDNNCIMSINVVILLLTQADEESTSAAATQSPTANEAELITGTTVKSATKTDAVKSTPESIKDEVDVPAAYSLANVLFGLMLVALLVTIFWWLGGARCLSHFLGNKSRGRYRKLGKDEEK